MLKIFGLCVLMLGMSSCGIGTLVTYRVKCEFDNTPYAWNWVQPGANNGCHASAEKINSIGYMDNDVQPDRPGSKYYTFTRQEWIQ